MNSEQLALAEQVLAHIEADPRRHAQDTYGRRPHHSCGTAACIAGWAVILHERTEPIWVGTQTQSLDFVRLPYDLEQAIWGKPSRYNGGWPVGIAAASLLGLDDETAERLFDGNQPEATALSYLRQIIAGARADLQQGGPA
jgi:hypothetical protein